MRCAVDLEILQMNFGDAFLVILLELELNGGIRHRVWESLEAFFFYVLFSTVVVYYTYRGTVVLNRVN